MVKLQVKDEKVKYEIPDDFLNVKHTQETDFDWLYKSYDLTIKYNIANELAELNRTLKTVKMSLINMSQVSSDQYYKRTK